MIRWSMRSHWSDCYHKSDIFKRIKTPRAPKAPLYQSSRNIEPLRGHEPRRLQGDRWQTGSSTTSLGFKLLTRSISSIFLPISLSQSLYNGGVGFKLEEWLVKKMGGKFYWLNLKIKWYYYNISEVINPVLLRRWIINVMGMWLFDFILVYFARKFWDQ